MNGAERSGGPLLFVRVHSVLPRDRRPPPKARKMGTSEPADERDELAP
jgi:hypothetical protein